MTKQSGARLQNIINGPLGIIFLLSIVRLFNRKTGYKLAETLGSLVATSKNSNLVRAVRSNQWVVSGCNVSESELSQNIKEVFINHGRCLYDSYKFLNDPQRINEIFSIDDKFMQVIENSQSNNTPQILVMPHYSNYEMAARAAALNGLTVQVLSYPNPGRSYQWQNNYRNYKGIEVTPISISSLREAVYRLKNGGTIFTGVDRPYGNATCHPVFFDRPSNLPTGYIRLAIKTGTPIWVILCQTLTTGKYQLSVSDPIKMVQKSEQVKEERINAEAVLKHIENHIRTDPCQWSMFYPVWPDCEPEDQSMEVYYGEITSKKRPRKT